MPIVFFNELYNFKLKIYFKYYKLKTKNDQFENKNVF